jgi:hypothetical protein
MLKNTEQVKAKRQISINNRLKRLSTIKSIFSTRQKSNKRQNESPSKFFDIFKLRENKNKHDKYNKNEILRKVTIENKPNIDNSSFPIVRFDDEGNPDIPIEKIGTRFLTIFKIIFIS